MNDQEEEERGGIEEEGGPKKRKQEKKERTRACRTRVRTLRVLRLKTHLSLLAWFRAQQGEFIGVDPVRPPS
jgi:hypothetical protein